MTHRNYKIGDTVYIKSKDWYKKLKKESHGSYIFLGPNFYGRTCRFVEGAMSQYCGMKAKITKIDCENTRYNIDIDDQKWSWTSEMFDESKIRKEKLQKIHSKYEKEL